MEKAPKFDMKKCGEITSLFGKNIRIKVITLQSSSFLLIYDNGFSIPFIFNPIDNHCRPLSFPIHTQSTISMYRGVKKMNPVEETFKKRTGLVLSICGETIPGFTWLMPKTRVRSFSILNPKPPKPSSTQTVEQSLFEDEVMKYKRKRGKKTRSRGPRIVDKTFVETTKDDGIRTSFVGMGCPQKTVNLPISTPFTVSIKDIMFHPSGHLITLFSDQNLHYSSISLDSHARLVFENERILARSTKGLDIKDDIVDSYILPCPSNPSGMLCIPSSTAHFVRSVLFPNLKLERQPVIEKVYPFTRVDSTRYALVSNQYIVISGNSGYLQVFDSTSNQSAHVRESCSISNLSILSSFSHLWIFYSKGVDVFCMCYPVSSKPILIMKCKSSPSCIISREKKESNSIEIIIFEMNQVHVLEFKDREFSCSPLVISESDSEKSSQGTEEAPQADESWPLDRWIRDVESVLLSSIEVNSHRISSKELIVSAVFINDSIYAVSKKHIFKLSF
ncbi:hypothetical protein ADUPG1_010421 [Aduncisulcus paluster]|uniref:Uncharacterized protein n=1 Tax=Aduncisulcus paluster TaxID=2918883 RepID=A0ABQ5JRA8_9EUKA|nr:hypothetical protein ADUPG1_010421 [Aduncisulcus paluster]|eukprot:gnl/Carplike_NY0171/5310_a7247_245.p1 GENE.gnl/Carplike_NY0171/5310_a7247_245~~gnl/Carplike_NY0171/5310_a7247_245.p1  ORF type:complete len:517 (-),score=53.79 gnl/Carplike_NY0171/5310_a7247_245:185-1696(-)